MIEVKELTQVYKSGKGVFDLSFDIKKGEVFGYLGPNGAGKTTTIRNILGFSNASKGQVLIQGKDARMHAADLQKIMGYLPGEMAFFDNMTGDSFLKFMGQMRGMTDFSKQKRLVEAFELDTGSKIKKMSKGMKQKVGIVTAFMHDPEIIILDEPTSGLDPLMQNRFLDLIQEEKSAGKTIMMSSHIFEEVQRICDRAGIIKDGRMVAIHDIKDLKALKTEAFLIKTNHASDGDLLRKAGLSVKDHDQGFVVTRDVSYTDFFKILAQCHVLGLDKRQQSIEEIFMKYYGKEVKNGQ